MSVPFRTLWDLRHLGPEDIVNLAPAQLRVAAALDPGCRAKAATLKVSFKARQASTWHRYTFQLQPADTDPALTAELDASDGTPSNWRLAPDDVPRFRDAQSRLAALLKSKAIGQSTESASASRISCIPATKRPTHLSIFLRLGADKPYLALFRHVRIPKKAHPARPATALR